MYKNIVGIVFKYCFREADGERVREKEFHKTFDF